MKEALVKYRYLIVIMLVIAAIIWALYAIRIFVLPFALGLVLAYITNPLIRWLESNLPPRGKWLRFKRVFSVIVTLVLVLILFGGFIYLLISTLVEASISLVDTAPALFERVQQRSTDLIARMPVEVQLVINRELARAGVSLGEGIHSALFSTISSVLGAFNVILGFFVLPFFLFYLLRDLEHLKKSLSSSVPSGFAHHGRNIITILGLVLGRYIRAEGILGFVVGLFTFVGLIILKVPHPVALALVAGVGEVIPTLGPWISGLIAVFVTLALAPEKAIWVALLFLVVQILENNLLVPKIQSAYLRIHPAVMIVLLVFGTYTAGIWGLLLIGPLTATVVEIFKYVRDYCDGKLCQLPDFRNPG